MITAAATTAAAAAATLLPLTTGDSQVIGIKLLTMQIYLSLFACIPNKDLLYCTWSNFILFKCPFSKRANAIAGNWLGILLYPILI